MEQNRKPRSILSIKHQVIYDGTMPLGKKYLKNRCEVIGYPEG